MVVDIIVAVILLGSALVSFLRGFIREILTIFGIVGGLVASYVGGPLLVPSMAGWLGVKEGEEMPKLFGAVPYDMVAQALSYGAVFLGFAIILSIISHLLSEGASKLGLGALDRTLGVAFGLVRGILVLGILYLPVLYLASEETRDEWFQGSKTRVYVEASSLWLGSFIPKETTDQIKDQAAKLEETNEARKKLQDIGMLPGGEESKAADKTAGQLPAQNELAPIAQEIGNDNGQLQDGYAPDARNEVQELIEKVNGAQQQSGQQNSQQPNDKTNE